MKSIPTHTTLESSSSLQMLDDNNFLSSSIFAVHPPENMTSAQKHVEINLRMLHRATVNQQSAEINQILLNMELLAFSFSWFAKVRFMILMCRRLTMLFSRGIHAMISTAKDGSRCYSSELSISSMCSAFRSCLLNRQALEVNLPLDPGFVATLSDPKIGGLLYDRMRNLYHISITISPIFALTSRKFNNESHARQYLLAVRSR